MFAFLIKKEVNDDAVRLKLLCDKALNDYLLVPYDEALNLARDRFQSRSFYLSSDEFGFVFAELPEFQFARSRNFPFGDCLFATGRGKYHGFQLWIKSDGQDCMCSVYDGVSSSATGGARKLAKLMEKKYNVQDITKMLKKAVY